MKADSIPTPDLRAARWIVVNSSGGKDSQTALRETVRAADAQGVDRARIVVSYQDLGRLVWSGTRELVEKQAAAYGLRVIVTRYRNRAGEEPTLLDYVRARGKWPSNKQRYCTSEFKRSPGGRVVTALAREAPGDVITVFGFRAEESPARARKLPWSLNARLSTNARRVWEWLPIFTWTEPEVWADIRESGVPAAPAYRLGMSRYSCIFCIFSSAGDLMTAGRANRALLDEYVALEAEIGMTFQNKKSLADVRARLVEEEALNRTLVNAEATTGGTG